MPHKYHAKKTTIDEITFDSKAEANRYCELKLLEKAGEITHLELQPKFLLQEGYVNREGKKIKPIHYIADFSYIENNRQVVEDVKGFETKDFIIKKKIFEFKYPDKELRLIK